MHIKRLPLHMLLLVINEIYELNNTVLGEYNLVLVHVDVFMKRNNTVPLDETRSTSNLVKDKATLMIENFRSFAF